MGRTNPTFRDTLTGIEEQWQPYRRALRHRDQDRFDTLWGYARDYADAAGYLNHPDPAIVLLFSVCLGQQRRLDDLETRLSALDPDTAADDSPEASREAGDRVHD
jgi:hypothetical protein